MNAAALQTSDECAAPLSVSALARDHHGAFIRFLRQRVSGGQADPEDIAQDAYMRMLRYEGASQIRSPYFLLLRVAINVMNDQHRAERVRRSSSQRFLGGVEIDSDVSNPERSAMFAEDLEQVMSAIHELSPRCREVFLRHRFTQLAYPQLAEQFGISVKMVEKYISTALSRCAERVAEDRVHAR